MRRVLTGFTHVSIGELDQDAAGAVKGLTGNANFTFPTDVLENFTTAAENYHNAIAAESTGGRPAVVAKNEAREILETQFTAIAIIVNQQANGDMTKLLSSGIPLAAEREHHHQGVPENLQVKNGDNGNMLASVRHSPVGDHGSVFAYTLKSNTETDPNNWTQKMVNGHKLTIAGLTPAANIILRLLTKAPMMSHLYGRRQ